MEAKEIQCHTIMSSSNLPFDYAINPYTGCEHACPYCYARFMSKYTGHEKEEWGSYVDVKINAVEVLEKELKQKKKGTVYLSSVTDPYQPLEEKYKLTRGILEKLQKAKFPTSVQTKSVLALRDIDLFKKFNSIEVGYTITCLGDEDSANFEPLASPSNQRFQALEELKKAGISTYIFFGPILPLISDKNLPELFQKFADLEVKYVFVDKLNIKSGNWKPIEALLKEKYPEILSFFEDAALGKSNYFEEVKEKIEKTAKEKAVKLKWCY